MPRYKEKHRLFRLNHWITVLSLYAVKPLQMFFFLRKPMMIMAPKKIMAHNISAFFLMKNSGRSSSSWRNRNSSMVSLIKTKSMKL